ncbi:MAG: extensin family protein [Alphaproteobacteria bacterium]
MIFFGPRATSKFVRLCMPSAYLSCLMLASLLLFTLSFETRAQDDASNNGLSALSTVVPNKPGLKPKPSALYMELLNLKYPDQKPAQPTQTSKNSGSKDGFSPQKPTRNAIITVEKQVLTPKKQPVTRIIPESKPWISESSDVAKTNENTTPAKPVGNVNANIKIRPSNHMLGITVVKEKAKNKTQTRTKVKGTPVKTKTKKTKKKTKKKQKRRAPPTQHANLSSQACRQALSRFDVAYSPISNISTSGGCELRNGVSVTRIQGVAIKPAAKLNCDMVVRTADFINRAQNAASTYMGARIESLHHMSAYSCRVRPSGKISEHGFGNALDLGSIRLSNGVKTSVLRDWYSDGSASGNALSKFWYEVAGAGCRAYRLVLSPVSNAAHKNHLHLDAGRWTLCER